MGDEPVHSLAFLLGKDLFAFEINRVERILDFRGFRKLPKSPEFVRGVIELDDTVITVVDLGSLFLGKTTDRTKNTSIIVTSVREDLFVGFLVTAVSEVIQIDPSQRIVLDDLAKYPWSSYLKYVARIDKGMVFVVDPTHLLNPDLTEALMSQRNPES